MAYFLSKIHNKGEIAFVDDNFPHEYLFVASNHSLWFAYIANLYLATGRLPQHLSSRKKQNIVTLNAIYSWVGCDLFRTRPNRIILRCVQEDTMFNILKAFHDETCGGHFADKRKTYKVLHLGYYWPTLFNDSKKYVKSCEKCQRMG